MKEEKILQLEEIHDRKLDENLKNIIKFVVRDCSEIIRKNPMYTSLYQNPDTMAEQLLKAYGITRYE